MKTHWKKQPASFSSLFNASQPLRRALNLAILAALYPAFSYANPDGAQFDPAQVSIDTSTPGVTTITNSPNAIINWQNFSIGQNELTRFIQENGQSAVLNRIIGQNPSEILGQLISNGKVFLINPNGIVFGAGAVIDTQGFIASSLGLSDQDFQSGNYHFIAGSKAGNIRNEGINEGIIRAGNNGSIILIAPQIENNGVIQSDGGSITLAAGHELTITSLDDPEIRFQIQAPADSVVNVGKLLTEGGAINVFAGTIKHSGEINADSVEVDAQGHIRLVAQQDITLEAGSKISANNSQGDAGSIHIDSQTGTTLVHGTIEAKAAQTGKGGHIEVLGERVGVLGQAKIDTSGENGGGQVLIGGDYQGKNPAIHNAKAAYVGKDTTIKADALTDGDGGKVIVWSDETTRAYGNISARGGANSGNGGFAEVSGHNYLDFQGLVDTLAPHGNTGTLLLDPMDITINNGSDSFGDGTLIGGIFSGGTVNSILTWTTINGQSGNVEIRTNNAATSGPGDITITANGTLTGPNTLTLLANNNININNGVSVSASGSRDFNLVAGWNNTGWAVTPGTGSITLGTGSSLSTTGNIWFNAGNSVNLWSTSSISAGSLSMETAGKIINDGAMSAGNVSLKAGKMELANGTINGGNSVSLLSSNAIDVGTVSTDLSGNLELSNAELSTITTPMLRIGNSSSGAIDIKSALSRPTGLNLTSGGAITQQAGATINSTSLSASGTSVALAEANSVGVISGKATAGDFRYRSSNLITVSTVDGVSGITAPTSNKIALESNVGINQQSGANLSTGGLALKTAGSVMLFNTGNNISKVAADLSGGTGSFSLYSNSNLTVGSVLSADGSTTLNGITTNNQKINLSSNALSINNLINAGTGSVDLNTNSLTWDVSGIGKVIGSEVGIGSLATGRPITVGGACIGGTGTCLSITELSRVYAPVIGIGYENNGIHTSGDIYVAGITYGSSSLSDRNAATTRIGLLSGGSITQSATPIDVYDLGIEANGPVVLNAANNVTNLAAETGGQSFTFNNAKGFSVVQMTGGTLFNNDYYNIKGVNTCTDSGNCGNVSLTATSGDLNIPSQIYAGSTGSVSLNALNGSVYGSGTSPDIVAGKLDIGAYNNIFGAGGLHTQVSQINSLSATNGFIDVLNFGGVTLGPSAANPAMSSIKAAGNVTVTAQSPLTVNGGVTSTTGNINLTASNNDVLTINAPLTVSNTGVINLAGGIITGSYAGLYTQYFTGSNIVTTYTEEATAGVLGTSESWSPLAGIWEDSSENTDNTTTTENSADPTSGKGKNAKQCTK